MRGAGGAGAGREAASTSGPRRTRSLLPTMRPLPPRGGRLQHLPTAPQDPARHSPFRGEVATGSSSETGRGGSEGGDVWAVGGGCRCVTRAQDGEFGRREPRGAGTSSHGRRKEEKRGGRRGGGGRWRAPSLK